jgi:RimJ/RimL family protein N-acetyltransferase
VTRAGQKLQQLGIKYAFDLLDFKKIKLEVFTDNIKALNLYYKFKFIKTGGKTIGNRELVSMELIN